MENETQQPCCHVHGHWLKKVMIVFVIIALVCGALYLALLARNANKSFDYIGKSAEMQNVINISGEGKVTAVADIAKVQIGLTTDSATVAKAQEENTKKMNEIIKAVKAAGVADKDVKTAYYYINPKYDWTKGSGVIVGFTVSQAIDIKIRNTEKISDILKVAADKGANNIGSLTFEIDEPEKLKVEARIKAIDNAKEKADALATQLGVKLGRVISFSESGGSPNPSPYYDYGMTGGRGGGAAESAPSIQTGENEVIMNVSIAYEIL